MAGFFNTNWDLGNMFNSPYSNTGFYNQDEDSSIVPRPGGGNPDAVPTNTWGAPTGYDPSQQSNNIFNPYSTGSNNNYYNPYSFGQTTSGTQYGGGQQQPWWMNYNMGNSVVNPPNIPQQSVQPQAQAQAPRRPQGTGPNGKDLNYAETIKYFGLYDGAENAFSAGDKQAAYRQDHMQWRSGTGAWEGKGKQEGQSDLDYPGRTTDAGDIIMGDRQKLTGLSGMFGGFDPFSMFNSTANEQGGTDYTVADNGTMTTGDGTTVETQLTNPSQDFWTNRLMTGGNVPLGPAAPNAEQRNWLRNNNTYVVDDGGTITESDLFSKPLGGYGLNFNRGASDGYKETRFPENLGTGEFQARQNFLNTFGKTSNMNLGRPDDSNYVPFQQDFTTPRNLFGNENLFLREPYGSENMSQQAIQEAVAKAEKESAQRAEAQAAAKAKADAAVAEKERQATAAQSRMNNKYETGPVPKNIFTAPKASTGYKTKDVNNSFAARRDIRNIFA